MVSFEFQISQQAPKVEYLFLGGNLKFRRISAIVIPGFSRGLIRRTLAEILPGIFHDWAAQTNRRLGPTIDTKGTTARTMTLNRSLALELQIP